LLTGEKNFGYLVIAVGFGMFAGMSFISRLSVYLTKMTIVTLSFLISGAVLFIMATISDIKLSLILIFFLGVCNIFINSSLQTILQSEVPEGMRGRVFGVQNMLINSAFTFPLIVFGAVADIWGIRAALHTLGATMVIAGFIGFFGRGLKTST